MVLNAERDLGHLEPFDGPVVEVDVCEAPCRRGERCLVHREAVVLACDLDARVIQALDWMIAAAWAERELESARTEGQPDDLMTERDPEHRYASQQRPHGPDGVVDGLGISRPVR